jgi:oligopeptidase B
MNMRPDLFKSAIMIVPFLDVVTPMKMNLPLSGNLMNLNKEHEKDEWGDINTEFFENYISSYSPYQNLKDIKYPNILIIGSLNDFRVPYWIPLKYTAKIRYLNENNSIILKNMDFGHFDDSSTEDADIDDILFQFSFLIYSNKLIKEI